MASFDNPGRLQTEVEEQKQREAERKKRESEALENLNMRRARAGNYLNDFMAEMNLGVE